MSSKRRATPFEDTIELHQQRIVIDSHAPGTHFTRCQQCHKSKDEAKKLFTCKACEVTKYCSVECQKKHWPTHKPFCKNRRLAISEIQGWDHDALADASASTNSEPLPSEILTELQSFTSKFGPDILQCAFNALKLIVRWGAWENTIVWIGMERLPGVPPTSCLWSRMQVKHVVACPTDILHRMWGREPTTKFLIQKRIQESHHIQNGYSGCITISLSCKSSKSDRIVHNTTFIGLGPWTIEKLTLRDDWEDHFKNTVERASGRGKGIMQSAASSSSSSL